MADPISGEPARLKVLSEVSDERARQVAQWGEQNHRDGTGPNELLMRGWKTAAKHYAGLAKQAREVCQGSSGDDQWDLILLEEVFEALAESDPAKLRGELVQVAAVVVAWVEAIDRREPLTVTPL